MTYRKKLIEVALPLEAINKESAREKSIRHGHPSTLHLWWSRKPLATCRAVLFASLVDDPGEYLDEKEAEKERRRLFGIIEELVKWENTNNEEVFNIAQLEIAKSIARQEGINLSNDIKPDEVRGFLAKYAPPVLDPFAGGGSIPLEALRLGLNSYASDLNPVAVLITKALIEIPSKFANMPPVNPEARRKNINNDIYYQGASGLADDVRYYGRILRDLAFERIGHLYPKVKLPKKYGGNEANVIAWLWTRTVECPNPACRAQMPLVSKFWLSQRKGREAWIEPIVDKTTNQPKVSFDVRVGKGTPQNGTVNRRGATCLCCDTPVPFDYIRAQGRAGRINNQLLAVVAKGKYSRVYLKPEAKIEMLKVDNLDFLDDIDAAEISGYFNPPIYGFKTIGSMFNHRQKIALYTFASLIQEVKKICLFDSQDEEYAKAIAVYLTLGVGRLSNRLSSFSVWNTIGEKIEQTFSEQGVGMAWDFAEANPFSGATGSWDGSLEWIPKCLEMLPIGAGAAIQKDAAIELEEPISSVISTDPPYYSSITYADFADYFYGTFRYALKSDFPKLFSTITTPKLAETVAAWHRFGGDKVAAGEHFRNRLSDAIKTLISKANEHYPISIYYAFKEREFNEDNESYFTAWESILSVLINCGLQIVHTWPLRTERTTGRKAKKNSLASSIVLVCRKRVQGAPVVTLREFNNALKRELPLALKNLQRANIAPIDLAQASIGPGMAVFSIYDKVLEADGSTMSVRTALSLVNQVLDEYLTEMEGEYDSDTRWAVSWFNQFGIKEGPYGDAETLTKAKNTSIGGLVQAGIITARGGHVKLLSRDEYPGDWDPAADNRPTVWEAVQHIIIALEKSGEEAAARLLKKLGPMAEAARDLSYRLFNICERKGWAGEALAYNGLVVAWPRLLELAAQMPGEPEQRQLF